MHLTRNSEGRFGPWGEDDEAEEMMIILRKKPVLKDSKNRKKCK
jgi:hypothetical protein